MAYVASFVPFSKLSDYADDELIVEGIYQSMNVGGDFNSEIFTIVGPKGGARISCKDLGYQLEDVKVGENVRVYYKGFTEPNKKYKTGKHNVSVHVLTDGVWLPKRPPMLSADEDTAPGSLLLDAVFFRSIPSKFSDIYMFRKDDGTYVCMGGTSVETQMMGVSPGERCQVIFEKMMESKQYNKTFPIYTIMVDRDEAESETDSLI
jgi:hypothetical protein